MLARAGLERGVSWRFYSDVLLAPEEMKIGMWVEVMFDFVCERGLSGQNGGWEVRKGGSKGYLW